MCDQKGVVTFALWNGSSIVVQFNRRILIHNKIKKLLIIIKALHEIKTEVLSSWFHMCMQIFGWTFPILNQLYSPGLEALNVSVS